MKHHPVVATRAVVREVDCKVEVTASHLGCEETEEAIAFIHRGIEIAETSDIMHEMIAIFNLFYPM